MGTHAITTALGTVGVTLDPIRSSVFAHSIAPHLDISMPHVATDTYANTVKDVAIVARVETYGLSAKSFHGIGTDNGHRGDNCFADYAMGHFGGWFTNKRMPNTAKHVQQGILYRKGRSMMGGSGGMRTAVSIGAR